MISLQEAARHLHELRTRLIRVLVVWLAWLVMGLSLHERLYQWVARPLLIHLPQQGSMVITRITDTVLLPLRLAFWWAMVWTVPYLIRELWGFIAPGLYARERQHVVPVLLGSGLLALLGVGFAYCCVLPWSLRWMGQHLPPDLHLMADVSAYLDFLGQTLWGFALVFQVPLVTHLSVRWDWITRDQWQNKRPHVIVGSFVVGMLVAPPDVLSQTLVALPFWGLFELGLWLSPRSTGERVRG